MTNNLVPVEQVDRDAAADVADLCQLGFSAYAIRKGKHDDRPLAQAFARHRLSHQPTPDSGEDAVERVSKALAAAYFPRLPRRDPNPGDTAEKYAERSWGLWEPCAIAAITALTEKR